MSRELDREYRPETVEETWIKRWEKADAFRGDPAGGKAPFCIVIPPPNVTGNLHIGHVLVYTLHDVVVRYQRMRGRDVLWLPGTDHAGIATQMVVERELEKEGTTRHELGREAFQKRVWDWKETYGNRITDALRRLGSSCDWSRERFTLDEGLSEAVREVFVRLYNEDLIYRDRYIVNWCPRCSTALSDLETDHHATAGRLYTIRYPAADGGDGEIRVATTRPETLLGDTGVAVHPEDSRFAALVGQRVEVPLTGRDVPVLADTFVDPAFGTGAVKITPAHDPNDFAAGRRLGLQERVVIGPDARMTDAAGEYAGLDRLEARKKIVADLDAKGLLVGVDEHEHAVGHCQRCHTMVEPLVSTQWFVRIDDLARPAISAVESGRTKFIPDAWSKTYFEWMRNIHDWCISRQLWWGHRIPAWYCDACETTIVSVDEPKQCDKCAGALRQDEDVLDTWFSSALWPFSTLGWPHETTDLQHYYPTSLLITGHDIIFFWVARMIMMGLKFQDDVPFGDVYIHGLVRDAQGQKMSKSKGNTIEPAVVQEKYGTDAVRFTMAILAAPGNDIPLAPERMEGYRAFVNKLWNATRFVLMRLGDDPPASFDQDSLTRVDRWILSRLRETIEGVDAALAEYRFDRAADLLYHFVWGNFCDWYIEFLKPDLGDDVEPQRRAAARGVLLHVSATTLRLLHPFIPFVTEELWERLPHHDGLLAVASWPTADAYQADTTAEKEIELMRDVVARIRNLRAESQIPPGKPIEVVLYTGDAASREVLRQERKRMATLVRASGIRIADIVDRTTIAARGIAGDVQIAIPLEGLLDLDAERSRLRKEQGKVVKELESRKRKLSNRSFLAKAPEDVVAKERELQSELAERLGRLDEMLAALGDDEGS